MSSEMNEKLEPYQLEIYEGLKKLGEDIADFYIDGVLLYNGNDYRSKSNLLAHLAREIDGGLRDLLSPKKEIDLTKKLSNDKIGGHVASILTALNEDLKSEVAKEWVDVATKFHRLAHRDSKNRKIRDPSEIEDLWLRYEDILLWLVGSYYNYLERIDRILTFEEPSKEILDSLDRLLENKAVFIYFFANLQNPNWLKPLKERGYFDLDTIPRDELDEKSGSLTQHPWLPLFYLMKLLKENSEDPNPDIINISIEIVNSIIDSDKIDSSWVDSILLEIIGNLPGDKIEHKQIEFTRTVLKSSNNDVSTTSWDIKEYLLPKLIKSQKKDLILHLLDIMFDFTDNNNSPEPLMDELELNDSLKDYKDSIIELCEIEAADVALKKLKKITDLNPQFRISAIEDHPQNLFLDDYKCQLVHFIRDIYESQDSQDMKGLLKDLIKEEPPIFKRLAIHTINIHYSELKDLFWEWDGNPLKIFGLRHEIYMLLNHHFPSFNEEEVEKLINWIEDCDHVEDEENEEKEIIEAARKLKWLEAVKNSENTKIKQTYLKYKEIYPEEIKHPDFSIWVGRLRGVKEVCPEEIYNKSNREIAEYLNDHGPKDSLDDSRISIKECVKNNPHKFMRNLEPFLKISRFNQHEFLDGLLVALRDGKDFEWDEILDYIESIIDDDEFWKEEYSEFKYRDWIIGIISEIIQEKTKDDDNPFKEELLSKVCRILIKLSDKTDSELYSMGDIVTSVLNSPKGKIYYGMINFSLSYARQYKNDDEKKWYNPIKLCIEKKLENPPLEFSFVLAEYLRFLYYIDKNWVINNIDKIFIDKYWEETFTGYIRLHANPFYEDMYKLVREKGLYKKAINTDFKDEQTVKNLVYHICSAYFFDMEKLDDNNSLIRRLIEKQEPAQLYEIVRFFLLQKDGNYEKAKLKIKPTWNFLFNLVVLNPDNFKEFLAYISRWLVFFDEIDDELLKWLMLSAKYVNFRSNHRLIVGNLLNCVEKSPENVAKIFIEMLNNGAYPDYKKRKH